MNASAMPDARDVNYDMLLSCVNRPTLNFPWIRPESY